MNLLIFIANVLDPQYKMEFLEYSLNQIYGNSVGGSLYSNVKAVLSKLFDDYSTSCKPSTQSSSQSTQWHDACGTASAESGNSSSLLKARFKIHKMALGIGGSKKTKLLRRMTHLTFSDGGSSILRDFLFYLL